MEAMFRQYGLPVPAEEEVLHTIRMGIGIYDTIRWLHPDATMLKEEDIQSMIGYYRKHYLLEGEFHAAPFEGAEIVLRQLKQSGKSLVVVSNKGVAVIEASLERLGLRSFFDMIVGDGSLPGGHQQMKPDPAAFQLKVRPAFEKIDLQQIVMIGDALPDLQFAANSGIASCWAAYGYGNSSDCMAAGPKHVVSDIRHILDAV